MSMPDVPSRPIYMDHNATTPVDPRVLEAMLPYFTTVFGNAASTDHLYGAEALQAVQDARTQIAHLIHAQTDEIVFTSGATEANNLAIIGVAERLQDKGKHIITCVTEHHAVLDVCRHLEGRGWQVTYLPVDQYGLIDPDNVRRTITNQTVLISIMTANNEIGTIAPIAEIGHIAHDHDVLFHTDATQAVGYLLMDVEAMNIDLLSMSAHKMYGPKGVGALYVRKRRPRVYLAEQMHGGGHERGMRSGTLNVPGIVGMGKAAEIIVNEWQAESERLSSLRNYLWYELQANISDIKINGHTTQRLPHTLNVAISGIENRSVITLLKNEVAISAGSACTTASMEPSHVIVALGLGEERAHYSLRLGVGRSNTMFEIQTVAAKFLETCCFLRKLK
jgi:cysteine desulfurase